MLLTGGVAWLLAGLLNKWLEPLLDPPSVTRTKALISLAVLVLCAVVAYFILLAIQNTAGSEEAFIAVLVGSYAAQKMFFTTTDSILGLKGMGSVQSQADRDAAVLDSVDKP
jgi:phosphotransferase system  glucose/maltose/N-acetylglucosamine-specific IIC component